MDTTTKEVERSYKIGEVEVETFIPLPTPRDLVRRARAKPVLLNLPIGHTILFRGAGKGNTHAPIKIAKDYLRWQSERTEPGFEAEAKAATELLKVIDFVGKTWTRADQLHAEDKDFTDEDKKVILGYRIWRKADKTPAELKAEQEAAAKRAVDKK